MNHIMLTLIAEANTPEVQGLWSDAWAVISDAPHAIAEMFYNVLWSLVSLPFGYFFYKKYREPKIREEIRKQLHQEIDTEHGVEHTELR